MRHPLTQCRLVFITFCGCLCLAMLSAMAAQALHQQATSSTSSSSTGIITGRVVNDEGQPLSYVEVYAIAAGDTPFVRGRSNTDGQGRFQFTLINGSYLFNAKVPGYVSSQLIAGNERVYYHLGDTVTLRMIKGGVITGRVTDANGEPITGLSVRVWRVHDTDGASALPSGLIIDGQTDDRGIYRIYGLLPGSYLVGTTSNGSIRVYVAGMNSRPNTSWDLSPRVGQAPTFYPSSTSDTAAEVTVRSGEEASGIDIRFRGERGFAVSGTIADAATSSNSASPESTLIKVQIILHNLATRAPEAMATIEPSSGKYSFALYGVPDGEYELVANGTMSNEEESQALPRHVSVKKADVTGIELTLLPLSSISGRIALESSEPRPGCEVKRPARPEEITLTPHFAEKASRDESVPQYRSMVKASPDGKGEFILRNLTPARYRLETNLPGETWYVKSITSPYPAARQPIDMGRDGLTLKAGEKATGVTITIADGAASLRGQIKPIEGGRLPSSLRVHLVPAEREQADNVLRYAEAAVGSDGQFVFGNLAPGRYWIIARFAVEQEAKEVPRPAAWDNGERAKVRREAEAAKVEIELQPCQRLSNYVLSYPRPTGK